MEFRPLLLLLLLKQKQTEEDVTYWKSEVTQRTWMFHGIVMFWVTSLRRETERACSLTAKRGEKTT